MIMDHQFETKVVRVSNAVAAGTTAINSDVVDTQGYDGVEFLVPFGAIVTNGVQSVKAQSGDQSDLSDAADMSGSSITVEDDDDNKVARVNVIRPLKRYVRCVVSRATQNSTVDAIIAILYKGKKGKEAEDSTVCGATTVANI